MDVLDYPLPRETRETDVLVGDGGTTYGPFPFKIFDEVDVKVFVREGGTGLFFPVGYTVTKTSGQPFDTFSIELDEAITSSDEYLVRAERLHERLISVTRGGALSAPQLEKELSKQGSVLDELRRDLYQAARSDYGQPGLVFDTVAVTEGKTFMRGPGNTVIAGPTAGDIAAAQSQAAAAAASASAAAGSASAAAGSAASAAEAAATVRVVATKADLLAALADGGAPRVEPSLTSVTLEGTEDVDVLPLLHRIDWGETSTLTLPATVRTITSGNIAEIGARCANLKLKGADPLEKTFVSVVSSTTNGVGDHDVVYELNNVDGMVVGQALRIVDVEPYPINSGNYPYYRDRPILGELYSPVERVGTVTIGDGSGGATFANGTGSDIANHLAVGDLLHQKAQTKAIDSFSGPNVALFASGWTKGVTASRGVWASKPNTGTAGTGGSPSSTVTVTGGALLSEAEPGDMFVADGYICKVMTVPGNGSLTVDRNITLANGTPFSVIKAAMLHEGTHRITAIDAINNRVTVKNLNRFGKPPVLQIDDMVIKVIRTCYYQTAAAVDGANGHGFMWHPGGAINKIDNIAIFGIGGNGYGFCLNGYRSPNPTQIGAQGTGVFGENVSVTGFFVGLINGQSCNFESRYLHVHGCTIGIYAMEASEFGFRIGVASGNNIGVALNSGAVFICEVARFAGNNEAIQMLDGSTAYGEIPYFWGNNVDVRTTGNGGYHANEALHFGALYWPIYSLRGRGEAKRCVFGGFGYSAFHGDMSDFDLEGSWISGNSNAPDGMIKALDMSRLKINECGLRGGAGFALIADDMANVIGKNSYWLGAASGDVTADGLANVDLRGAYRIGEIERLNGARVLLTGGALDTAQIRGYAYTTVSGITPTIAEGVNAAAMTRNATGDYTLAFDLAQENANYAVSVDAVNSGGYPLECGVTARTTANVRVLMHDDQTPVDPVSFSITIFSK